MDLGFAGKIVAATAGLAAAFAPKGIRINGINPGSTLPCACGKPCRWRRR